MILFVHFVSFYKPLMILFVHFVSFYMRFLYLLSRVEV